MNKIFLIIQREYLTRVRKRSFIVMTILGPILMAMLFILPVYLATRQDEKRQIQVIDETGWFSGKFEDTENYRFIRLPSLWNRLNWACGIPTGMPCCIFRVPNCQFPTRRSSIRQSSYPEPERLHLQHHEQGDRKAKACGRDT
jgi:hypothetical protein